MPNAYRAKGDISVSRVTAVEGSGENRLEHTESVTYPAGAIVLAENMTDHTRERAESGDLDHLLAPVSDEEAKQASGDFNPFAEDFGIFVPEHEAEAHALQVYGHQVVPPDQALEAQASGAQYAADYQSAVREHGIDRRPVQEQFAEGAPRVPDELIAGGQTRSGVPHNRGPEGYEGVDAGANPRDRVQQAQAGQEQVEAEVRSRPRPGSESEGQGQPDQSGEAQAQAPSAQAEGQA